MRQLGLAAAAAAFLACSQIPVPAPVAPGAEPAAARTLFRVRYEGHEGAGSLRVVMRRVAARRFQLQASDTFGRAVWSLDLDGDEALLVDHRRREACVSGGELRVPELALRPLPLPAVPRVLAGQTPLPTPSGADRTDWTDRAGQRWTARWQEGRLVGWTLWQDGEPRLWWSGQPRGGILSHRDGSQFRWRQVTSEAFPPSSYQRVEVPAEYRFGECRTEGEAG